MSDRKPTNPQKPEFMTMGELADQVQHLAECEPKDSSIRNILEETVERLREYETFRRRLDALVNVMDYGER